MIIHKESKLSKIHEHTIYFDECYIHDPSTTSGSSEVSAEELKRLRGSSRRTKNIALIVALKKAEEDVSSNNDGVPGYIVATSHFFWHPRYVYERVRYVYYDHFPA